MKSAMVEAVVLLSEQEGGSRQWMNTKFTMGCMKQYSPEESFSCKT
jgi:hypothetical protein